MFSPFPYSSIFGILLDCLTSLLFFQNPLPHPRPEKQWKPPHDFLHDITPLQCHSHNDYYHPLPLYDALFYGCTSIEVDVWAFDNELYVGHYTRDLVLNRTLRSLYLDPLIALLNARNPSSNFSKPLHVQHGSHTSPETQQHQHEADRQKNGIFPLHPNQTLILLIDFKNNGSLILSLVQDALAPLREKGYLTHFNGTHTVSGPLTVVATGHAPFELLIANPTYRDIFFDAPLAQVSAPSEDRYNTQTSYLASANFRRVVGHLWLPWRWGRFYSSNLKRVRGLLAEARRRGLKTRFWGMPSWPRGLRDAIWEVLVREGVDLLNGDDLAGMAEMLRREVKQGADPGPPENKDEL